MGETGRVILDRLRKGTRTRYGWTTSLDLRLAEGGHLPCELGRQVSSSS